MIREAALAAAEELKTKGGPNTFLERISGHAELGPALERLRPSLAPERFTGRAEDQVQRFLKDRVQPLLAAWPDTEFADEVKV